uniref:Probable alpha-galactosidase B n=1 Tax=Zeugodacus cucurbitae TaxID=28588 RepID=A0A0A1WWD6_ZEUCU
MRNIVSYVVIVLTLCTVGTLAIRCYQCSSDQDRKGYDSCGAYKPFNRTEHIPIECNSDESHMPGSFCMKVVQQGPRGFIWDGRWRQVIRRCASVSDTGVTGVCNWGVYENGVYWEECYCSSDSCNGASSIKLSKKSFAIAIIALITLTCKKFVN